MTRTPARDDDYTTEAVDRDQAEDAPVISGALLLSTTPGFHWPASAKSHAWLLESAGSVAVVPFSKADRRTAIAKAKAGEARLYVVWTGQWTSNTFLVDTFTGADI